MIIRRIFYWILAIALAFWEWLVLSVITTSISERLPISTTLGLEYMVAAILPILAALAIWWFWKSSHRPSRQ
jgi:uncharacterized membrane-anchored protein